MHKSSIAILILVLAFSIVSCGPKSLEGLETDETADREIDITASATGEDGEVTLIKGHKDAGKIIVPEIRELDSFRVIGMGTSCTYEDTSSIHPLWETFLKRMDEIDDPGPVWGISYPSVDGIFYLACAEVLTHGEPPADMESREIPAGTYAVFEFNDQAEKMSGFIGMIMDEFLPNAKLAHDPDIGIVLELYPEDSYDEETGNLNAEILVPVIAALGSDS